MFSSRKPINTWKDALQEIQDAKDEIRLKQIMMTDYERDLYSRAVKDKINLHFNKIVQGVRQEHNQRMDAYSRAVKNLETKRSKESAKWDMVRLGNEIQAFQILVSQAMENRSQNPLAPRNESESARVRKLYQDAMISNDPHRMRAAAEVVRSLDAGKLGKDGAVEMKGLIREADARLTEIRTDPEVVKAMDEVEFLKGELLNEKTEIIKVAEIVGEPVDPIYQGGAFGPMIRQVQVDPASGEVKIYSLDDQAVTGIDWSNLEKIAGQDDFDLKVGE